ncbi:MAG TPA: TadE/TadG family type IV pilus assembly protein [Clostridia bacterium]|nr:TadE/TadG family type IV pilus assembly protein [Clostridia bacterium]
MRKCFEKLRSRGSVTVEACVVLPVFLTLFFLLLFMVKFICTGMLLDHAVNETAKEIATSAYPISFINEFEDEKLEQYGSAGIPSLEEELEKLGEQFWSPNPGNAMSVILSGDLSGEEAAEALEGVLQDYGKGIIGKIVGGITPLYWDMKSSGKYYIADALIREHLDSPLLKQDAVRLRLVEFPQGRAEFAARSQSDMYESFGLAPGIDFNADDVVIRLEYDYRIKLPFVKELKLKLVYTAVERAWLKGSFGVVAAGEEGLDLEPAENTVFITRTGIRYHLGSCRYLRKSKLPIDLEEAKAGGYTPCKVCKPGS